jgi:hypothetical protein
MPADVAHVDVFSSKGLVLGVFYRPRPITLALTAAEAQTLADILAAVGGKPNRSRRDDVDAIDKKLAAHGVEYNPDVDFTEVG